MTTGQDFVPKDKVNILIADDYQENIEMLTEYLTEYGYTIIPANNGLEALDRLKNHEIHLIIADAMMPKMDGFQLCRMVRDNPEYAAVPFFMYTGDYMDAEDREFAKSIGVDKYIVKSDSLDELIQGVNDLIKSRYGYNRSKEPTKNEPIDNSLFLEKHHSILIKKLEEKMHHLEIYAETLNQKNIELKASEARYRSLFENADIGIVILDRETKKILDANHKAVELFKYTREELLEMDYLPIKEDGRNTLQLLHTEFFYNAETSIVDKNGGLVEVHCNSVPMSHSQDPRIIVYLRDLSEQIRIRQKLLQIENMTLMGKLAAGIAHEIRNPLAAVSVNLQYLRKRYSESEDILKTIEMAMEGTKRVEQVIDKTLSLARATPPLAKAEDIGAIIDHSLWFLKLPLKQKQITIQRESEHDLPEIRVDEKQIQQVILNIVQNAIDVSQKNSSIKIHARLEENSGVKNVCVDIIDSGPGMSKEMQQDIFEPFKTTKKGGTGLGLAISKYIMDRHNSDIEVISQQGKGSTFRLRFPVYGSRKGDTH